MRCQEILGSLAIDLKYELDHNPLVDGALAPVCCGVLRVQAGAPARQLCLQLRFVRADLLGKLVGAPCAVIHGQTEVHLFEGCQRYMELVMERPAAGMFFLRKRFA